MSIRLDKPHVMVFGYAKIINGLAILLIIILKLINKVHHSIHIIKVHLLLFR